MKIGVVGGGIFGIAAALALRGRGHAVAVFDQGPVPHPHASSTDVAKAIRRSWYAGASETYVELVERAARQWRSWQMRFGTTVYHRTGGLTILPSFAPGSPMYESWRFLQARGATDAKVLSAPEIRARFPQFTVRDDEVGFYDGWRGYLESGRAVAQLARLARAEGVQIHEETPVLRVEEGGDGGQVVVEHGAQPFDRVVVAAGVWIGRLLPQLGRHVEVTRQQMVFIEVENPSRFIGGTMPVWSIDPDTAGWYGFPLLREGYVKVSKDPRGEIVDPDVDRSSTPEFVEQVMAFLHERIPDMAAGKVVGSRSCLYANTPDDHFVIDWVPGSQRILVAGGGSGHGFKFGGSIGAVIADAVEDKDNPLGRLFRIGERLRTADRRQPGITRGFARPLSASPPASPRPSPRREGRGEGGEGSRVRIKQPLPCGEGGQETMMQPDATTRRLYDQAIVIDGLNVSSWDSPAVFRSLHAGGVTAINATIVTWENYPETLDTIAAWLRRFGDARSAQSDESQDGALLARHEYDNVLTQVKTVADIRQAKQDGHVGIILGFQNATPIENDLDRLAVFHALGVRIIQLTFHERNLLGNGCYEPRDDGLSHFGVDAVRELNRLGILVDLSHCGNRTTLDAIEKSEFPVACTHANARSYFDVPRNKTDEALKLMAERGGVVGATAIAGFLRTGWESTLDDYVDAIDHLVELLGIDHVAIGTDFTQDQPVSFWRYIASQQGTKYPSMWANTARPLERNQPGLYPRDLETPDKLPNLAAALLRRGYSPTDTAKLLGENWLRLFQAVWAD